MFAKFVLCKIIFISSSCMNSVYGPFLPFFANIFINKIKIDYSIYASTNIVFITYCISHYTVNTNDVINAFKCNWFIGIFPKDNSYWLFISEVRHCNVEIHTCFRKQITKHLFVKLIRFNIIGLQKWHRTNVRFMVF